MLVEIKIEVKNSSETTVGPFISESLLVRLNSASENPTKVVPELVRVAEEAINEYMRAN